MSRRSGTRRVCTRCRVRRDPGDFVYAHAAGCGVCRHCVRPDDSFPEVVRLRVNRVRTDGQERRAELRAQIQVLMSTPLTGYPLSEQDREQVRRDIVRSMRASAYDGSELVDLGGE